MRIKFEDVTVRFGERTVLDRITVELTEQRIGVIGLNGSGKSTFGRLINGLIRPTEGVVRVEDLDTVRNPRMIRRRVGFVFQDPDNQIVMPIVAEDMTFGLRNIGIPRREIPGRVRQQLERFGISELAERASHSLSGGEKQLVAVSSVLVMEPDTIVLDEPTTLLDLRNRNLIRAVIDQMAQQVVLLTHDLELLDGYDRVLVVDGGRIVDDGKPGVVVPRYVELYS
jgi:biotin transport system ATP-binding protein